MGRGFSPVLPRHGHPGAGRHVGSTWQGGEQAPRGGCLNFALKGVALGTSDERVKSEIRIGLGLQETRDGWEEERHPWSNPQE